MSKVEISEETKIQIKINYAAAGLEEIKRQVKECEVKIQRLIVEGNEKITAEISAESRELYVRSHQEKINGVNQEIARLNLRLAEKELEIQTLVKDQAEARAKRFEGQVSQAAAGGLKKPGLLLPTPVPIK